MMRDGKKKKKMYIEQAYSQFRSTVRVFFVTNTSVTKGIVC